MCLKEKQFISFSTSTHYRWKSTRLFRHYTRWRSCCLFSWLKRLVAIFLLNKMNLQCGFWCARCSILKNDPRFIRIEGKTEKWPSTTRMFLAREYFNVCFILYTLRWVWLLFDNFDNICTNKTDKSQLTVGIWSVFEPVGTPRNTCRHNFFITFN